ncbi:hypothetical protein [Phaeobacter italicus]|jgi:hypothetical protein|uniref:hypothetical protein n=1 Tax=Phaeobacter italicus TaxID=481446 RepID=UPI0002DDFD9D|nr:hypothetical protein [Phaeobacter italicus]MCI5101461.1 hypothetical protein [Phaeobacter italicus]
MWGPVAADQLVADFETDPFLQGVFSFKVVTVLVTGVTSQLPVAGGATVKDAACEMSEFLSDGWAFLASKAQQFCHSGSDEKVPQQLFRVHM